MVIKDKFIEHIGEYAALAGVLLIEIDSAIMLLFFMVIIETFLGAKIAIRAGNFSWRQFLRSFTKIIWFGMGLFTAAAANQFDYLAFVDWVHLCAGIMAAYELRQIMGKVDILAGTNILQTIREILDSRLLNIKNRSKEKSKPNEKPQK